VNKCGELSFFEHECVAFKLKKACGAPGCFGPSAASAECRTARAIYSEVAKLLHTSGKYGEEGNKLVPTLAPKAELELIQPMVTFCLWSSTENRLSDWAEVFDHE
jgi:hypothetical protein